MADEHSIIFKHPLIARNLLVKTGANQITWGYGLNTAVYPTFGGEVVQVLSAYTDDLVVTGDVRTYRELEGIYRWFLQYMQVSTQAGGFHDEPVRMSYPARDWNFKIKPTSLPGFRLGTDVVAPSWQLQASITEQDPGMADLTLETAIANGFDFNRVHAGIGWDEDNPFTDPAAKKSKYDPEEESTNIADFYQKLLPSYLDHDFDSLFEETYGSRPTRIQQNADGTQNEKSKKGERDEGHEAPDNSGGVTGPGF